MWITCDEGIPYIDRIKYLSKGIQIDIQIMKKALFYLAILAVVSILAVSCEEEEISFDETLLIGKWQSGTLFYKYLEDGTGAFLDDGCRGEGARNGGEQQREDEDGGAIGRSHEPLLSAAVRPPRRVRGRALALRHRLSPGLLFSRRRRRRRLTCPAATPRGYVASSPHLIGPPYGLLESPEGPPQGSRQSSGPSIWAPVLTARSSTLTRAVSSPHSSA